MNEHEHTQAPADPKDSDRFACARCGYSAEFVVLDDGRPGEWVDTSPHPDHLGTNEGDRE